MKRIFAMLLCVLMLLPTLAGCASDADTSADTTADTTAAPETTAPVPADIILNAADAPYTIIRDERAEEGTVKMVAEFWKRLTADLPSATGVKLSDDWARSDEEAQNDRPEILVGITNRRQSHEAADALPGFKDFSISIRGPKICIYANSEARLSEAIEYFLAQTVLEEGKLIYRGGDHVDSYVYPMADLTLCGRPVGDFVIVFPIGDNKTESALAYELQAYLGEQTGATVDVVPDSTAAADCEILIGRTNRPETASLELEGGLLKTVGTKVILCAKASAYYYSTKAKLLTMMEEQKKLDAGIEVINADAGLDFFLNDAYAAGLVSDEINLGVLALLSSCEYFNDRMTYGSQNLGERWVYSNRGANAAQTGYFDDMLKSSKKGGNCASPLQWAFTEMGIMPTNDRFYGGSTGNFASYSGKARETIAPYCEVFDYYDSPIPFKDLYAQGLVKAGDIFLCKHHTFIYRGDQSFYAAGHDGAWHTDPTAPTEDERKAVFDDWVLDFDELHETGVKTPGKFNTNYTYKCYYVVRLRDDYVPKFYRNKEGKLVANPMVEQ